jgi:hypothetical protein
MHPELEYLCQMLDEASELLSSFGSSQWADWLRMDAGFIRGLDFYGVEHLLSAFGGMGSLNDVVLISRNEVGSSILMPVAENERFDFLRTSIYDLARKLAHEGNS